MLTQKIVEMTANEVIEDGFLTVDQLMEFSKNKYEFQNLLEEIYSNESKMISLYSELTSSENIFWFFCDLQKKIESICLDVIINNMKPIY